MAHKNNTVDVAKEHAEYVLRDPAAPQERKDKAAGRLIRIAQVKATQRRDVRLRRLQAKLDIALARITELEAQAPKQERFNTLRDQLGLPPVG
ncbi:MAG: hypothetical protein WBX03_02495 [Terriglobales bacterium]